MKETEFARSLLEALYDSAEARKQAGVEEPLEYLTLSISYKTPKRPPRGERVTVAPGLLAELLSEPAPGRRVVLLRVFDVIKWLARNGFIEIDPACVVKGRPLFVIKGGAK
jgi:hypothetical protein